MLNAFRLFLKFLKYSAGKVGKGKSSAGTTGWNTRKGRTPPRVVDSLTDAFESQLILNPTTSESALRNQGKSKSGKAVSNVVVIIIVSLYTSL